MYYKQIQPEQKEQLVSERVGLSITMNSINGGFGFRIVGGRDINAEMIPQVDLVAPGMCALDDYGPCLLSCCNELLSGAYHIAIV